MVEKRFIRLSATRIKDTKTGENHICYITLFNEITKICDENEQLKQFKELFCAVLKQEYEDRTNEMNRWAEKEDWNGYRATQLEYGTVIRIAKRIGVDLE